MVKNDDESVVVCDDCAILTWMWSGERAIFGLCHSKTKEDQDACHNPPIESLHTGKCYANQSKPLFIHVFSTCQHSEI